MKHLLSLVFIIVLINSSCSLFQDPNEQTMINIEEEYRVDLWQDLVPGENPLEIVVSTVISSPCNNSEMRLAKVVSGSKIFVSIIDIINPTNCEPTSDPLLNSVLFDLSSGSYDVDFDLDLAVSNNGVLDITESNFSLNMDTPNGIKMGITNLQRIPNDRIWGSIEVSNESELSLINNFLNSLQQYSNPTHGLSSGNYGHFSINNQGGVSLYGEPAHSLMRHFIVHSNANPQEIKFLFEGFRQSNPGSTLLAVNSDGTTL